MDFLEQLKVTPERGHSDFLGWRLPKPSAKSSNIVFTIHDPEKTKYTAPIRVCELA